MLFNLLDEPWLPVMPRDSTQIAEVSLTDLLVSCAQLPMHGRERSDNDRRAVPHGAGADPPGVRPPQPFPMGELWRVETDFPVMNWPHMPKLMVIDSTCSTTGGRFSSARRWPLRKPRPRPIWLPTGRRASPYAVRSHYRGRVADAVPRRAARWLITAQLYDTGGLKTPYTKDKSSKAGLGNRFACTLVEGETLHETLLLNTLVYNPAAEQPWMTSRRDRPVWEADELPIPT